MGDRTPPWERARKEHLPTRALGWLAHLAWVVGADDLALARRPVDRVVARNSEPAALWADHGPFRLLSFMEVGTG